MIANGTVPGSARDRLRRQLDLLSEDECTELLRLFDDIVAGERYWEHEIATLYNERVKFRSLGRDAGTLPVPAAPESEEGIFAPIPIVKARTSGPTIALPPRHAMPLSVGEAVTRRRSRRDYAETPLAVGVLGTLLAGAAGVTGQTEGYGYARLPLRAFPSSGGLQVPEVYVAVRAVEPVTAGLYRYVPGDHGLELLREGDHSRFLEQAALGQPHVGAAAAVIIVTGCFDRLRWKYGERGYRYLCIDVGYVGENLYLAGEALGIGVCAIAGFMDDAVERYLGVDGRNEIALLMTTVGVTA